ncbi:MAG: carboxymuconolactone decarboxylase family protein [Capsulimonas sp.]|jgi:AhpD family alkylhydroperoxidase|uniref:carboxymuconolactone decarboxylase family protein n=1 Tax=Capsulimonas sp. TaxID=2494211 RepID=UPI00326399E8
MTTNYPEYRTHLQGLIGRLRGRIPGTMKGFGQLHQESMKAGALSEKQKELMALGIGIASRCDGCITFHTHEALAHGASAEEIGETIGVAVSMGGGPALMYAAHALEALEQFEAARA